MQRNLDLDCLEVQFRIEETISNLGLSLNWTHTGYMLSMTILYRFQAFQASQIHIRMSNNHISRKRDFYEF